MREERGERERVETKCGRSEGKMGRIEGRKMDDLTEEEIRERRRRKMERW